jgi:hypothetical protein
MFDRTQSSLLIFLCGLVLLTVLAVLAANIGLLPESETTASFAKWGMAAVLAEIIGLFTIVARGVFSKRTGSYSLIVKPLHGIDIAKINWDVKACYLEFSENRHPIKPVLSPIGAAAEIKLPYGLVDQVGEATPVDIYLKDTLGNHWTAAFFLNQKTIDLQAQGSIAKIRGDY